MGKLSGIQVGNVNHKQVSVPLLMFNVVDRFTIVNANYRLVTFRGKCDSKPQSLLLEFLKYEKCFS